MTSDRTVRRTYYLLTGGKTLAASLIWGINTIFLLDAGLSNVEAFAANAFFTAGMVLFEVPTGIVADRGADGRRSCSARSPSPSPPGSTCCCGRSTRRSGAWAVVSVLLGLGFTFFSGATEAWLVDALTATGSDGRWTGCSPAARSSAGSRCCSARWPAASSPS